MNRITTKALKENAGSLTILFVKNNTETGSNLESVLKQFFKHIHICVCAKEALIAFNNTKFDLIVTDCYLPDMPVQDMLLKIKKIAAKKPIIVTSNIKNADNIIEIINMGINGYIQTPIDVDKVLPLLVRVTSEIVDMQALYAPKVLRFNTTRAYA